MGNCIFTCTDAKRNEQTDDRQEDSHCTQNADRKQTMHENTVTQLFTKRRKMRA